MSLSTLQRSPDRAGLLAGLPVLAEQLRRGEAERERTLQPPLEGFRLFRQSGLGALRIPRRLGGPGGTVSDLFEVLTTLAGADPNLAHALRPHYNFTEELVLDESNPATHERVGMVLGGTLFGSASTELGTTKPGEVATRLTRHGDRFRLNGRKFYATGTAFADYATFSAVDESGSTVTVLLPTGRAGITVLDDWDGMGQRLTASGGVKLDQVEVLPHEISERRLGHPIRRHCSALRQLHLAAVAAGIVRAIAADAQDYATHHARAALHSPAAIAREDPFVQQVLGEVAAASFAADAIIAAASRALDRSAVALSAGAENVEEIVLAGGLAVAQAQLALYPLALRAAEMLFETGGASATASRFNFDRHWRNIRTLSSHNPLRHKARVVGDYLLNGTRTQFEAGRVF